MTGEEESFKVIPPDTAGLMLKEKIGIKSIPNYLTRTPSLSIQLQARTFPENYCCPITMIVISKFIIFCLDINSIICRFVKVSDLGKKWN